MNWTFGREEIALKVLPSGHALTAPIFRLQGKGSKKCYVQANNHGGEIAGNGAIFAFLKKIASYDIYGTIIIVPHCNPVSLNTQIDDAQIGVYDAATGQNWNRLFQLPVARSPKDWRLDMVEFARNHKEASWESIKADFRREIGAALQRLRRLASIHGIDYRTHFALQLQSLSYDADFVLDLHTGDTAPHYLYAPEYALKSAPYFYIPHVLAITNDFGGAFDEAHYCPWMMLLDELHSLGRTDLNLDVEAYTVELGSLETIHPTEMEQDAGRILNYLKHKEMISGEASLPTESIYWCKIEDYNSYCSPASGLAVIPHAPGSRFTAGSEIGYVLTMKNFHHIDRPEQAQTPIRVEEDGIFITRRRSPIVFEGQVLFKLMTNYKKLN